MSGFFYSPKSWDTSLTRGGPMALTLPNKHFFLGALSDTRKSVSVLLNYDVQRSNSGSHSWTIISYLRWNLRSNVSLTAGPMLMKAFSVAQWVTQVPDPLQTLTFGSRYVFADILQNTLTAEIRLNWTFTPRLSLQIYLQPFLSVGKYSHFKELARSRSFDFNLYGTDKSTIFHQDGLYTVDPDGPGPSPSFSFGNPDFNFKFLRGTTVLRWEFAPGSSLYFVWTQNRADYSNPEEFGGGRDLRALFRTKGDNVFLIKFSYLFNL